MFASAYFAIRYFASRYFPHIGATFVIPPGPGLLPGGRTFTVGLDDRTFFVAAETRIFPVPTQ